MQGGGQRVTLDPSQDEVRVEVTLPLENASSSPGHQETREGHFAWLPPLLNWNYKRVPARRISPTTTVSTSLRPPDHCDYPLAQQQHDTGSEKDALSLEQGLVSQQKENSLEHHRETTLEEVVDGGERFEVVE